MRHDQRDLVDQALAAGQGLGAATWFGGQLFAATGLHPAVEVLSDQGERTRVIAEAWRRYRPYGNAGLALAGGATVMRTFRAMQQREGGNGALTALNLACAAATVAAAAASGYLGKAIESATPGGRTPITTATQPADETPARARQAQRWLVLSEGLALAFGMGLIVTSALLGDGRAGATSELTGDEIRGGASTWRAAEFGTPRERGVAGHGEPPVAVSPAAGGPHPSGPARSTFTSKSAPLSVMVAQRTCVPSVRTLTSP